MNIKNNIYINFFFFFGVLTLSLSIFFNYFYYDDAWILKMLSNNTKGIYNTWGLDVPRGAEYLYDFLFLFNKHYDDYRYYFLSRVIFLFFTVLNLILAFQITNKYLKFEKKYFIFFIIIFVYWFSFHSGGITSRPDSLISFCLTFTLFSYFYFNENKTFFFISVFINIFLFFYHPLIFYILCLNLFFIFLLYFEKKINLNFLLLLFAFFVSLFFLNFERLEIYFKDIFRIFVPHYNNDININKVLSFQEILSFFYTNIYKDLSLKGRVISVYYESKITLILFSFLYFICFLNFYFFFKKKFFYLKLKDEKKFFFIFIFIFISLNFFYLLMPNKWGHHLALIVPILGILNMYFIKYLSKFFTKDNFDKIIRMVIFLISLFFLVKANYYFNNNLILKKFLNIYFSTDKIFYFKKLTLEENVITNLSEKYKNKKILGNPAFYYLFNKSYFIGENIIYLKKRIPDIIIVPGAKKKFCNYYSKRLNHNFMQKDIFIFNAKKWSICVK